MQHPPGYKAPGADKHVLRLRKTLYGLKQSGSQALVSEAPVYIPFSWVHPVLCRPSRLLQVEQGQARAHHRRRACRRLHHRR